MNYVAAIVFMVIATPLLMAGCGYVASRAADNSGLGPQRAKRNACAMYATQFALPLGAVTILWVCIVPCCTAAEAGGFVKADLPLHLVCAPFTLWFAVYSLGGLWGLITLPFSSVESLYAVYDQLRMRRGVRHK